MVSISGGQETAVRIQANPGRPGFYDLSLEDVRKALGLSMSIRRKGVLEGQGRRSLYIGSNDKLISSVDYRPCGGLPKGLLREVCFIGYRGRVDRYTRTTNRRLDESEIKR